MKERLVNHQQELGLCEAQKSKQQNVLNRILLLLLAMMFLPIGAWAEDSYFGINTSSGSHWVTDETAADVLEDGSHKITYDIANNILTLNGIDLTFTSDVSNDAFIALVDTDHPTLTVRLVGDNTLTIGDKACVFNGWGITFTTDTSNPGTLTINTGDNWGGALFIDNPTSEPMNATYNNGLSLTQNGNTYTIQTSVSYNITVAGTAVTSANASNVLNDDYSSVSYDAENKILTLNNASIIPESEEYGITYTGTANLTINLKGTSNVVKGNGGCPAIGYFNNAVQTSPNLTFTQGDTEPCSLLLEAVSTQTIDGFGSVINTGLYKIDETIPGNETTTYRTTITSTLLSGGSGTAADPFIIKTADDLKKFAQYVNNTTIGSGVSVKLSDDISESGLDCSSLTGFEAIGIEGNINFTGTFDGNNKIIKNLSVINVSGEDVGLFRCLDGGTIKQLILDGCSICGGTNSTTHIGGIVGNVSNNGTISKCTVQNGSTISCSADSQTPTVGGIVGFLGSGSITECVFQDSYVKSETSDQSASGANANAGGIVGVTAGGTVSGCRVKGTTAVSANYGDFGTSIAGALLGNNIGGTFSDNTYEYTVTVKEKATTKSGYTHRGTNADTDPTGISLYTKIVSLPDIDNAFGTVTGSEGTYYKIDDGCLYVAPGQTATIDVTPNTANYYALVWLQAVNIVTTDVIACDSTSIDGGGRQYTFEMPEEQVNINVHVARDISLDTFIPVDAETIYNGTAQALSEITFTYNNGNGQSSFDLESSDFTVTKYTDSKGTDLGTTAPTNADSYTVSIEGKGDCTGTKDISYTIHPRDLEAATIEAIEDQIYTGEAITPEPQVSIVLIEGNEATVLVKGQDFTYSYEANTNISSETTPKVIVTGKGNYTGTAQKTFNIVESYNVWVAGTLITSGNAANVTGSSPAKVTYDAATNTLTLNGAYIVTSNSAGIKSGLANLKVVLSGGQSEVKCTGEDYYAFESTTENAIVTFSSSAASVGYLDITTAGYNKFFKDITPAYDGITHFDQTSVFTNEYYYHIRKSPWTGSGTENDPYLISTTTDLKTMSSYAYQGIVLNQYFKLNNDIDWSQETGAFNSIGRRYDNYRIYSFNGTFDGNYKTISNLTSSNGMFNYVMNEGSVKNLTLTNCTVTGSDTGESAGGLVADFRSSGAIQNCSVKSSTISNGNYPNITTAGGIVGYQAGGTIENCNIEDVTVTTGGSPTYTQSAGGIVGHTYNSAIVNGCSVKANSKGNTKITNTSETDKTLYAGAIVGWREQETTLTSNTYQGGVVVETQKGNNAKITKSGNTQRGLGDGDDTDGAVLESVKKITVTKNDKGTVEYVSGIYKVDGNDIYALPFTLSDELTVIKGTSAAGYDEPTIAIKTVTNNTDIDPETADGTSEGLYYAQWEFEMPNDNATATILFAINLAKASRNFVIADRDYTSEPLPVTEIKTTLDDLDGANPAFIELTSGTHFNITGYKDSKDVALGTTAPTNAGNYKVTIQGIGDCTGTVTLPFVISRLAITPTLIVSDWIYGGYDVSENGPSLTDGSNPGNGAVTFYFKKDGENEFHTMEVSSTTDAGNYSVYATIAQSTNYEGAQTETKTFNITQLDISNATVTLDNTTLIYNGSVQTVNVTTVIVGDIEVPIDCYEVSGNTEKEAGDYKLTVTAKTMDSSGNPIKNNFTGSAEKDWKIKYRTVTADELGLSENQTYATYFNNTESLDLPDGIVAYIITGVSGTTVTTKRISYIPKNVAVLVENGTSTEDAVDAATDNQLLGTADAKDVSTITGGAVYVLYKSEFVKTTTGTIPANRCYLVVSGGAGARSLSISHGEGNDTGIDNLVFDEDGTEKWYDLRGRRIEKPTKAGLYIRNGEKIVVNDNNK